MPFAINQDVIQALAPERPDHPFRDGVRARGVYGGEDRFDPSDLARARKSPP